VLDAVYGASAVGSGFAALYAVTKQGVISRTASIATHLRVQSVEALVQQARYDGLALSGKVAALYAAAKASVLTLTTKAGATQHGEHGAEVSDEEPKI
jgi:hypothetical protein